MAPEIKDEAIPVKGILATIGSPVNGNVSLVNVAKDATVVLYKNGIVTNKGEAGEGDVSIAADKTIVVTQEISAAHDVSVKSNAGHIYVKHAIEAKEGSINVTTGEGNIHVGDSGPNRKTITAKKDITLATDLGKIDIHGKTESLEGDITLSAKSKEYNPGADGMNILLSDQGVVKAAGYVNLKTENGDIHITDRIISGEGLTAEITKQGSVYFDRSVLVNKDVLISADQGSIHVGNSVASRNGNISMQTVNGHVNVDNNVTALNGDISLKTVEGDVRVNNNVTANHGNVTAIAGGDVITGGMIRSGKEISLKSNTGNIVSVAGSDAYLDAGTQITLQAEKGNVGSADQALRHVALSAFQTQQDKHFLM